VYDNINSGGTVTEAFFSATVTTSTVYVLSSFIILYNRPISKCIHKNKHIHEPYTNILKLTFK